MSNEDALNIVSAHEGGDLQDITRLIGPLGPQKVEGLTTDGLVEVRNGSLWLTIRGKHSLKQIGGNGGGVR